MTMRQLNGYQCIERQYDTRNHRFALRQSHVHYDMHKFCFSNRIIPLLPYAIFSLLTCAKMSFLALFGPKPWNYYLMHFTISIIFLEFFVCRPTLGSYSFRYKLVLDTTVIRIRIFTILGIMPLSFWALVVTAISLCLLIVSCLICMK